MDPDDRRDVAAEIRRQRAAIAAQACELCRSRKSKCDEQRPKCGLCRRLNVDCNYRDPRPTKKDKALGSILQALHRTEDKLEQLLEVTCGSSTSPAVTQDERARPSPRQGRSRIDQKGTPWHGDRQLKRDTHLAALHRVVLWPAVSTLFHAHQVEAASDLLDIAKSGSGWFIQQELDKHPHILSPHLGLQTVPVHAPHADGLPKVTFPSLTRGLMKQYADRYFNTYNLLYPILDYADFMQHILPKVIEEGFGDGCFKSLIALLVFALGKVALDGEFGKPIATKDDNVGGIRGRLSGVRGGSIDASPGLEIFNEAQRRLGFVISHICLENTQILLLKAMYFETCSRHAEFWRTTSMASEAVKVMLKRNLDWASHEGDMIKRAYWVCNIIEGWCHADLDLPESGISDHQDEVPLPLFVQQSESRMDLEPGSSGDMLASYQYNFLGMIAIRQLIDRIGCEIYDVPNEEGSWEGSANVPTHIIKELDRQLMSWRTLLPQPLEWTDEQRTQYMWYDPHTKDPNLMEFVVNHDGDQLSHVYNIDIIIAQLRSRFYYCRFLIYRPFLYKALHFPEQMTDEDIEGCVIGLESCLMWPVCMWPVKNKKRLIPNIFVWTQSFLSILILLRMAAEDTLLKHILETRLPRQQVRDSIDMMLDWMRDMRHVSGIAAWSWKVLEPLYKEIW